MVVVVIHFPNIEGLKPIFDYLHTGLWTIGNKSIDDMREKNNLIMLEWITRSFTHCGFEQFLWLGGSEIYQTHAFAQLFEYDFNVKIDLQGSNDKFSVEQLIHLPNDDIMLYPGSLLTNSDFTKFHQYHKSHGKLATILVNKGLQYRVGIAKINPETKIITEFLEKPFDKTLSAYTGIILLQKGWKQYLQEFLRKSWKPVELSNGHSSIDKFVKYLIEANHVKVSEITPIHPEDDPWWIDLSELETWMKLDSEEIFHRLRHLNV